MSRVIENMITQENNFGNVHQSQRGFFSKSLYEEMLKDDSIYLILVDLGYLTFNSIIRDFPDRVILTGASEQAAMGIAVGLAQEGKKPFIYTITSFFLRCAETISLYVDHEKVPVRICGAGRDDDYGADGFTHFAYEAQKFIRALPERMQEYYPKDKEAVPDIIKEMVAHNVPSFISLKR